MWAGPFLIDRSQNVATESIEPTSGALQGLGRDVRVIHRERGVSKNGLLAGDCARRSGAYSLHDIVLTQCSVINCQAFY
jgi:hypothetical protein